MLENTVGKGEIAHYETEALRKNQKMEAKSWGPPF